MVWGSSLDTAESSDWTKCYSIQFSSSLLEPHGALEPWVVAGHSLSLPWELWTVRQTVAPHRTNALIHKADDTDGREAGGRPGPQVPEKRPGIQFTQRCVG